MDFGGQENGKSSSAVCVTGASGYIGSWLVKLLLLRGYTVHATARSLNDPKKTEHLFALDGAKERLRLFEATLLEEGSFDSAIQGCVGVFHTASPVILDSPNPQADIIDPAVKGTLNVLASCAKAQAVKRVVLTSSVAAVMHTGKPLTNDSVIDETWFSTLEGCENKPGKWYLISKTLAEDAAWKFAKERGIDLVVINPSMVIGPFLQPTPTFSAAFILSLINGLETYRKLAFGWIHVKDVAEAHVRAFEIPSANGRYLLIESIAHASEAVKIIHELYPTLKHPIKCNDDQPFEPIYKVSKEVRTLGIEYIPMKVGLMETVECLKEKKFISV